MASHNARHKVKISFDDERQTGGPRWLRWLRGWLLRRLWYVHPGLTLTVRISPTRVLHVLDTAARPSTQRLHLRTVFANGRRYFLNLRRSGGFYLTTTSNRLWNARRRTSSSAVLSGDFERIAPDLTRVRLQGRIQLLYLLDVFWLPLFMASLVIFMPWNGWLIAGVIAAVLGLSWYAHRCHAALEAHEMVYFVEKALEDYIPDPPPRLNEHTADVVYDHQQGFEDAWAEFFERHVGE